MYLNGKALVVVRSRLLHQNIGELLLRILLDDLLEDGLIVLKGGSRLPVFHHFFYKTENELLCRRHPAIQIDGGDQGLKGVRQDGGALPSPHILLPLSQKEELTQPYLLGKDTQALVTHQGGPGLGQLPLGQVGEVAEQVVRDDDGQHCVP